MLLLTHSLSLYLTHTVILRYIPSIYIIVMCYIQICKYKTLYLTILTQILKLYSRRHTIRFALQIWCLTTPPPIITTPELIAFTAIVLSLLRSTQKSSRKPNIFNKLTIKINIYTNAWLNMSNKWRIVEIQTHSQGMWEKLKKESSRFWWKMENLRFMRIKWKTMFQ